MYEKAFQLSKKNILVLIAWLAIQFSTQCQNAKIDSLKALLPSASAETRYELAIALLKEAFKSGEYEKALNFNKTAWDLAKELGDSLKIVNCGRNAGILNNRLGRPRDAEEALINVISVAKRNLFSAEYQEILNSLGNAYMFQGQYDRALMMHYENLEIRERVNNKFGNYQSRNNIALVYFKLKNFEKALDFYQSALTLAKNEQYSGLETLYINMGLCLNQLGRFDDANSNILNGLKVCEGHCSEQIQMEGDFGLGVSLFNLKQFEDARNYISRSLRISQSLDDQRFIAENLLVLAKIDVAEQKNDSAVSRLHRCEAIAFNRNFPEILLEAYKVFQDIYRVQSDFQNTSRYQSKYIELKDSVYSEKLLDDLAKVQTEYAERENIKTIATKDSLIEQQRDLNVAIAIIAILAGLLILVLQRSNRVSKQVNAQLSEAKETIQQQNKLLEIKNKDLDREVEKKTMDLERVNLSLKQVNDELDNFIYKTSHDIRGPLASLKGMCNVALMDVKDPVALDYLRKLDTTAERLNSILTRLLIINQINNSKLSLSNIDFDRTVDEIIRLERKKGMPTKIDIRYRIMPGGGTDIQSDKELVRIILENLIDNAIKFYNEAEDVQSFVDVQVEPMDDGNVKVRITDNGIGISESNPGKLFQMFFRASERSEIGGIGLYIVKTATTKIGGKVGLLTTPEGYTEFYVIFPKEAPAGGEELSPKVNTKLYRKTLS